MLHQVVSSTFSSEIFSLHKKHLFPKTQMCWVCFGRQPQRIFLSAPLKADRKHLFPVQGEKRRRKQIASSLRAGEETRFLFSERVDAKTQPESEDNEKHTDTQGERCCSSACNKNMKNIFGIEEAQEQRAEEPGGGAVT